VHIDWYHFNLQSETSKLSFDEDLPEKLPNLDVENLENPNV
jgi:hypothetical protein